MLTREFIASSLYQSGDGYFNSAARVYSSKKPSSIDFRSLKDRSEYYDAQQRLYDEYDEAWCTPVEIFKPYYSWALANWIVEGRVRDLGQDSVPPRRNNEKILNPDVAQQSQSAAEPSSSSSSTASPSAPSTSSSSSSRSLPPLRILEMGGGNGTCADGILDYLQTHYPGLYDVTSYTIVELSEYMHETQKRTLAKHIATGGVEVETTRGKQTLPRVHLLNMSIIDWREMIDDTVFVIGLEVLDNFPHDRLVLAPTQSSKTNVDDIVEAKTNTNTTSSWSDSPQQELQQTHVVSQPHKFQLRDFSPNSATSITHYKEVLAPISDPWIMEYGRYWNDMPHPTPKDEWRAAMNASSRSNAVALLISQVTTRWRQRLYPQSSIWFPTTQLMFLHILKTFMPKHHVLLADFSHLPSTVEGVNGPVVSTKSVLTKGKPFDHDTYLVQQGCADIFFPTNFPQLKYVYRRVCRDMNHEQVQEWQRSDDEAWKESNEQIDQLQPSADSPLVLAQHEFMGRYAKEFEAHTRTRKGWNPMWHDYANFHFFIT